MVQPEQELASMEILHSAMAFAVTMIIFSTIVTGIVELLLRLVGTREDNLKQMVSSLFNRVIWPRLKAQLVALGAGNEELVKKAQCEQFVYDMTSNPASTAYAGTAGREWTRKASQVEVLTTLAFAERLGRTDVGKAILDEGETQLNLLVSDFVRTFDRFGRAASEVFRKKAQQTAIIVGIVFALAANVDAGRLFISLMENPDVRSGLMTEASEAAHANKEAASSLAIVSEQMAQGKLTGDEAEMLKSQYERIENSITALEGKGLPIGYAYYPYRGDVLECSILATSECGFSVLKLLRWLLFCLLAGILIGLGSPFWFRVFTSLSQVFQVLRSFGLGSQPQQAKPEELSPASSAEESAKPKDILDAFRVAACVHAYSALSGGRESTVPKGSPK
jgi:hypothetical protein